MEQQNLGTVRIAPEVLATIVRLTALAVSGVTRLSGEPQHWLERDGINKGVRVQVKEEAVFVDLYIIGSSEANMLQVGRQIQRDVARAIDTMLGMDVREVNVYVRDVE
jgi:uncharacterized alkaline shock family protein YloU